MAGKKSRKKPVHVKTPFSAHKLPSSSSPACNPEVISSSLPSEEASHDASPTHPVIASSVKMCKHLEKGVNIERLSSKISKTKFSIIHCQDCAKDSKSGGGKKAKGRSNRKKAGIVTEQSDPHLQKKWVCLACGHIGCGFLLSHTSKKSDHQESAVDNDKDDDKMTAPMGHASKHSLCANHPLALQVADILSCWCFTCNMAVDCNVDDSPQSPSSSPLQAAVKMVHDKLLKEKGLLKDPGKRDFVGELVRCSVDDASQSNSLLILPPSTPISMHRIGTRRKRTVKGLMNLGNTCFFNSVMQNLLALDVLRYYFSQELVDGEGPLTSSLRKLYLETNLDAGGQLSTSSDASGYESGLKKGGKGRAVWEMNGGACNPRSLFGAICAKAPRFRGFQQQDSHELLRCLLEGLTSEERSTRAKSTCNGHFIKGPSAVSPNRVPTSNGDCSNPGPLEGEREDKSSENTGLPLKATTTVESFFGGQLCSTVRCCECGHSSVVYETMLDLSLQIPTQPTPKKGQKSVNQWKPSSFGGGLQQKELTPLKVPSKASLGKVSNATTVIENNKSSLQAAISAQGSHTYPSAIAGASSPKLALMESSPLDDVWLDFIDGGIQSAESSIQGSADVQNPVETSENNLIVDVEDCITGSTLKTASNSSTAAGVSCQNEQKTEFAVPEDASDVAMPSARVQNTMLSAERLDAAMPKIDDDNRDLKPLAHSEGEDGPLPLASGVLLLSYEPLEVSSSLKGEESSASFDLAGQCSLMDVSGLPLEADADLDGFAQLFEEEESSSAVTQNVKPSGGNLEDDQVVEESTWDDGVWEGDTAAYGRNEAASGPQRLANYEDTILPMSLESCLADFTKPELLCGENAWECESCTRRLKEKGKSDDKMSTPVVNEDICGSADLAELQVGREVACFTAPTARNCHQENSGVCNSTQNGNTGKVSSEGCESLSGESNENMSCRFSMCGALAHDVDGIQNGITHLANSNGGQLFESQSSPRQADIKLNVTMENQPMNKRAPFISKLEQNNGTGMLDTAGNANVHSFDADLYVEKKAQQDCSSLEHAHSVALPNSSKEKMISPVSKSITEAKSKAKNKLQPEKLVKKDAIKKLSISKAPLILTVHLKRFAQDMRGRLSKLSGHVSFPEFLDLRPFLDPRCLDSGSCYYQLVGVVEHGGTMRGGHYIAYVRSPGMEEMNDLAEHGIQDSWYYISDSTVRKASLQAVLSSEAYLLFYEKCGAKKAE